MTGGESRRGFLKKGLLTSFTTLAARPVTATSLPKTIRIEADGGGLAGYEFEVTGDVAQRDRGDVVTASGADDSLSRAYGHLGPDRGVDTFRYSGELRRLVVAGPATVTNEGREIDPRDFGAPTGSVRNTDFEPKGGKNVLRIEGGYGAPVVYEFEVDGSLAQRDAGDMVGENHAMGHVGARRGVDTFVYRGELTDFRLVGPATVVHDGERIVPTVEFPACDTAEVRGTFGSVLVETGFYDGGYVTEFREWSPVSGRVQLRPGPAGHDPRADEFVVEGVELFEVGPRAKPGEGFRYVRNPDAGSCRSSLK